MRDRLIKDHREFTGSFVDIHDKAIREHVADRMARGYQWPDPWLSLNPNFASGGTVTDLVKQGLLQPECEKIFRHLQARYQGHRRLPDECPGQ